MKHFFVKPSTFNNIKYFKALHPKEYRELFIGTDETATFKFAEQSKIFNQPNIFNNIPKIDFIVDPDSPNFVSTVFQNNTQNVAKVKTLENNLIALKQEDSNLEINFLSSDECGEDALALSVICESLNIPLKVNFTFGSFLSPENFYDKVKILSHLKSTSTEQLMNGPLATFNPIFLEKAMFLETQNLFDEIKPESFKKSDISLLDYAILNQIETSDKITQNNFTTNTTTKISLGDFELSVNNFVPPISHYSKSPKMVDEIRVGTKTLLNKVSGLNSVQGLKVEDTINRKVFNENEENIEAFIGNQLSLAVRKIHDWRIPTTTVEEEEKELEKVIGTHDFLSVEELLENILLRNKVPIQVNPTNSKEYPQYSMLMNFFEGSETFPQISLKEARNSIAKLTALKLINIIEPNKLVKPIPNNDDLGITNQQIQHKNLISQMNVLTETDLHILDIFRLYAYKRDFYKDKRTGELGKIYEVTLDKVTSLAKPAIVAERGLVRLSGKTIFPSLESLQKAKEGLGLNPNIPLTTKGFNRINWGDRTHIVYAGWKSDTTFNDTRFSNPAGIGAEEKESFRNSISGFVFNPAKYNAGVDFKALKSLTLNSTYRLATERSQGQQIVLNAPIPGVSAFKNKMFKLDFLNSLERFHKADTHFLKPTNTNNNNVQISTEGSRILKDFNQKMEENDLSINNTENLFLLQNWNSVLRPTDKTPNFEAVNQNLELQNSTLTTQNFYTTSVDGENSFQNILATRVNNFYENHQTNLNNMKEKFVNKQLTNPNLISSKKI